MTRILLHILHSIAFIGVLGGAAAATMSAIYYGLLFLFGSLPAWVMMNDQRAYEIAQYSNGAVLPIMGYSVIILAVSVVILAILGRVLKEDPE